MFLMWINKCRSLWLMGPLISHWILRKHLCQEQGICRLCGRFEKSVGNFHRVACERWGSTGAGERTIWVKQALGAPGLCRARIPS